MNWLGWNKHRRGLDGGQNSLNNINAQHHRTRHFNALTDIRNKTWTGILWIITGPFPQLRNNSHYVGTAVWPWGWLLVVFLQLRSKFASTNNMTAKGMAKKKTLPNFFWGHQNSARSSVDKYKPLHHRHQWRWVHPGWRRMNHHSSTHSLSLKSCKHNDTW